MGIRTTRTAVPPACPCVRAGWMIVRFACPTVRLIRPTVQPTRTSGRVTRTRPGARLAGSVFAAPEPGSASVATPGVRQCPQSAKNALRKLKKSCELTTPSQSKSAAQNDSVAALLAALPQELVRTQS